MICRALRRAQGLRALTPMTWRFTRFLVLSVCALAACGTDPVALSPETSSQETLDARLSQRAHTVIVLVVDDAATAEAGQLRDRVVESVRAGLLSEIEERWHNCGNPDPAAWHPGDVRLVVARPSAADGEALLTPIEMPSLAWITKRSTADEVDAVVAGAAQALALRLADAGEPYRPLRAAKRAVDLVTGARAPATDAEAAFAASLPLNAATRLVVASTRDDEDSTSLDELWLDSTESATSIAVVLPADSSGAFCAVSGPGDTRLQAWGKQVEAALTAWPCSDEDQWDSILRSCCVDCGPTCHAQPLAVSSDGLVECRVHVDQTDLERCDPERGFSDPDGQPTFVDREGAQLRRCEVAQLTGAALEACRFTLDCVGCSSGFCATEVQELSQPDACQSQGYSWPLRIVGGALDVDSGWIHVICQTRSPGG